MALSATDPIGRAYESTRRVLFEPFDAGKWFALGFCAFLANCGSGGGGSYSGNRFGGGSNPFPSPHHATDWIQDHLAVVVAVGAAVFGVMLVVWLLVVWLSSRGTFMFLAGVVENKGAVVEPWGRFRDLARSLMMFRLLLGLIGLVIFGSIVVAGALLLWPAIRAGEFNGTMILEGAALLGVAALAAIPLALISLLTVDFVAPVMYLRNCTVGEGWAEVRTILGAEIGSVVLYLVLKLGLGIASAIVGVVATCLTCCLAALPYLGTVILLPIPVFFRCYSLEFLAQQGGDFERLRTPA